MLKKITEGVGLVRRESYTFSGRVTREDIDNFKRLKLAEFDADRPAVRRARMKGEMQQILKDAGIEELPADPDPEQISNHFQHVFDLREDSKELLAMSWLGQLRLVEHFDARLAEGQNDQKTRSAYGEAFEALGELTKEIWWRTGIDPTTGRRREALGLKGQKMSLNGKRNRETKLSKHRQLREARFKRMFELVPKFGVDNAARQVGLEGLGDWQAIKKQWNLAVNKARPKSTAEPIREAGLNDDSLQDRIAGFFGSDATKK